VAPSPSSVPFETTVTAVKDDGSSVNLVIRGNLTSLEVSDALISTNQSSLLTSVFLTLTGESGTTGFSVVTVPKAAVFNGGNPVVFVDGQVAANQGFTEDSESFYVWFTTQFSSHQIKIEFSLSLISQESLFGSLFAVGLLVPELILVFAVIAVKRLRRKPEDI